MTVSSSIFAAGLSTLAQIKAWMGGDSFLNAEAIHDAERDIDADNINNMVAGLSEVAGRVRKGNLCCLSFRLASLSAGATAEMYRNGSAMTLFEAPWDGSLVALSATMASGLSVGTLTARASADAVDMALEAEMVIGPGSVYARQLPGVDTFSAGDDIRVEIETGATFAAVGASEIVVDAWFSFGEEEDV